MPVDVPTHDDGRRDALDVALLKQNLAVTMHKRPVRTMDKWGLVTVPGFGA